MPHIIDTPDFLIDLDEIDMEPNGYWELKIHFEQDEGLVIGSGQYYLLRFEDGITAKSDFIWERGERSSNLLETDLDGRLTDTDIQMQIYFLHEDFKRAPFICRGSAISTNEYQGKWSVQCLDPEACGGGNGCKGATGDFTFSRVN